MTRVVFERKPTRLRQVCKICNEEIEKGEKVLAVKPGHYERFNVVIMHESCVLINLATLE